MSGIDRLSDGYNPDFDHDLEVGKQGELFVSDVAASLANGTAHVETKADHKSIKTGRVYIEYQQKPRGYLNFKDSGILTTKAELWAIVLPSNVLVVAPTENVRELMELHRPYGERECKRGDNPTRGVAIRFGEFIQGLIQRDSSGS